MLKLSRTIALALAAAGCGDSSGATLSATATAAPTTGEAPPPTTGDSDAASGSGGLTTTVATSAAETTDALATAATTGPASTTGASTSTGDTTALDTTALDTTALDTTALDTTALDTTSGTTGGPELPPGCDADSLFIYLLDSRGGLHRFEPETLQRTELGALACPADPPLTMAMTIDRQGDAWVLYADRKIYRVDTDTLACEATAHAAYQQMFASFGLAFSADAIDGPDDTLFVSGLVGGVNPATPTQLARLSGQDLALAIVGPFSEMKGQQGLADLTGTGDARLYGFFASSPATLSEIDKQTGALIDPATLVGLETGSAWAFAFYAGEFWLFTATGPGGMTRVSTFDPETAQITAQIDDLGLRIVGAGVSTCVPVLPQ